MAAKPSTRRDFLRTVSVGSSLATIPGMISANQAKGNRPNILWITSEDNNTTFLGCYGNPFATTPTLDRLASEGILYRNAFCTAPVCAPTRSTIISGMYPTSLGTEHMRSTYPIPKSIRFFPQYLRDAGYYCTNNAKKDYNMPEPDGVWDESSKNATYRNRRPGQPFFAVFNIEISHESSLHKSISEPRHDPAKLKLPAYHPDTPEIRHDWAQYYDKVEDMDRRVGQLLADLGEEGLAEDTIVFYYADNGGILPRSKRFCYDSGLHVPMIIRFPGKYQHLAPARPGTRTDRLVTFVDLAPAVLSLAGIPIPPAMQGSAFLGSQQSHPREVACSFRGRMDERYDMVRTVRDKRYRYVRNYNPHRIYAQHVEYLWLMPATRSWERLYREGRCDPAQRAFWEPKAPEELYDLVRDPDEVHNLAGDPAHQATLQRLRKSCLNWMMEVRDAGFVPEGEMVEYSKHGTLFDIVHDKNFPLQRIVDTADIATRRNSDLIPRLLERLDDSHPVVRYWAATGCLVLGEQAKAAVAKLKECLKDASADVRVTAAEALCAVGEAEIGLPVLIESLRHENGKIALHAANALECLGEKARPALQALEQVQKHPDDYVQRAARYTVSRFSQ
jgi:N-sulfoglucosamine sulfohydrolase